MKWLYPIILLASMVFFSCEQESTNPSTDNPFLIPAGSAPLVVAHRGGKDLAPENTIAAFDNAVSMNVDILEMDVSLTKDDILVLCHDLTIDRTSEATGNINDYTFAELQTFNFGYNFQKLDGSYPYRDSPVRIPRLEEVLSRYPGQLMEIEVKSFGQEGRQAANQLVALLRSYDMASNVMVFSFFDDVMQHINSISGNDIRTGASISESLSFLLAVSGNADTILPLHIDMFAWPDDLPALSARSVLRSAHRNKAGIHYWTINDKEEMKSLIVKGADGIITDRPDLLQEVIEEMGF